MHIYTDDKAELARAIERSSARVAASDIVREEAAEARRPRLYERVKAKAIELARLALGERFASAREDGERGMLGGWPERQPELSR